MHAVGKPWALLCHHVPHHTHEPPSCEIGYMFRPEHQPIPARVRWACLQLARLHSVELSAAALELYTNKYPTMVHLCGLVRSDSSTSLRCSSAELERCRSTGSNVHLHNGVPKRNYKSLELPEKSCNTLLFLAFRWSNQTRAWKCSK